MRIVIPRPTNNNNSINQQIGIVIKARKKL